MAALRDSATGEWLATGPEADMVLLAEALGRSEVMFDDVSPFFDFTSTRDAADDYLRRLSDEARKAETERRAAVIGAQAPAQRLADARARMGT
jgi:hypothetical protein